MSLIRHLIVALLTSATGAVADVAAQWPDAVTPGTRVQVRLPESQYQIDGTRGHLVRGRITALAPDTVYLAVTDSVGPLAIPRALLQRLEISKGVPSRGLSAVKRGVLGGAIAAVTALIWFGLDDEPDGTDSGDAALVAGGFGLVLGSVFGALYPRERWKRVRLGEGGVTALVAF
jgi:hypothetical protein